MVDNIVENSKNPALGLDEMSGALRGILGKFLMNEIDNMLPAKVIAYDRAANRVQVQPMIAMIKTDMTTISRNQIASVPVYNIGGGGCLLSFNLNPGNLGWIKAADRDISNFLKSYNEREPKTYRAHDFADSVFFPDVMSGYTIDAEDAENAVLQTLDGSVRVALFPDKIKITAPEVVIDTPTTTITGNIQIDGDLNTDGAATLGGAGGSPIARTGDAVAGGIITGGSAIHKAT